VPDLVKRKYFDVEDNMKRQDDGENCLMKDSVIARLPTVNRSK